MEVMSHLASADADADVAGDPDMPDLTREKARLGAQVGTATALSIAMLDLADALRGATHAATTTVPGIQEMRQQRTGG